MPSVQNDLFWSLLLYLPYHITYEAETLPVHSSVPVNNKETIKQILIND